MGKRVARDIWVYDAMADFAADGGVATYGDGVVEIVGEQYVVKSGRLLKVGGRISANLGVLGDSIGFLNYDLLTSANNAIASQEGFITHFNRLRGYSHIITSCQAQSGFNSQNVIQTGLPALKALAVKPQVVFLSIGANDFFLVSFTAKQVLANVKRILNELAVLGITCVVLNGFPRSTWHADYSAGKQAEFMSYLQQLPALLGEFNQHFLIDTYSVTSSTGDITGTPTVGWTVDGIHPNQRYAATIGAILDKELPSSEALWSVGLLNSSDIRGAANVVSSNIMAGSTFSSLTTGSTVLPAGFTESVKTNVTSAFLVEAKTTDLKQLKITLNFSAAGSYLIEYSENGSYLSATDQWIASAKMALSGDKVCIASQVRGKANVSAGTAQTAYGEYLKYQAASGSGLVNHIDNFSDRLIATALASPLGGGATMSSAAVGWWVRTDAAGTVTMTISEPAMHKIPPMA